MKRPLWTYRPLRCMLGWHAWSWSRRATLVKIGEFYHQTYRPVGSCDHCYVTRKR